MSGTNRGRYVRSASLLGGAALLLLQSCGGVPLTAPSGTLLQITASPLFIPATGGASTITVIASKAESDGGGPVPDGSQIFFTTPIGTIEERVATTNGIARATLRSDGRSGTAEVVASSGAGASVTLNPPVSIGTSESIVIVLAAIPPIAPAPGFTSDILATVFDGSNQPLAGVPLVFSTTAGVLASAGTVLQTDAQGRASDRLALGSERLARVSASSGSQFSNTLTVIRQGATGAIVGAVSPARGSPGQTLEATISGANFESGASVTFGGGISLSILSVDSGAIRVRLVISSTAEPGGRDVTVRNPSGSSDTLPRGFTVTAGGPTVSSISPTTAAVGASLDVTISGTGFQAGARVSLGDGISVNVRSVSPTSIAARATISSSARIGRRDVTVTNPDGGSGSLSDGFTVESSPPTVTSVSPSSGSASAGFPIPATVTGRNFQQNAQVSFGAGITVTVESVTATSIRVSLTINFNAAPGTRDVTVTNPGNRTGTLPQGFTVTP